MCTPLNCISLWENGKGMVNQFSRVRTREGNLRLIVFANYYGANTSFQYSRFQAPDKTSLNMELIRKGYAELAQASQCNLAQYATITVTTIQDLVFHSQV